MLENQLSRYGALAKVVEYLQPGAKLFLVSDSDDTTVGPFNLGNEFPVDKDGLTRVYTTIQAASNAASANRGDVVAVLPGYDHTLGRADSWATAGVHIIGIGDGVSTPIVRYGAAGDEVGVAANSVHIKNLVFLADAANVTRALDFDTGFSGAHLEKCYFDFDSTGQNFLTMVRSGQNNALIEGNRFNAEDTVGANTGLLLREGIQVEVRDNYFFGIYDSGADTTNGGMLRTDTAGTALVDLLIKDNTFVSTDTTLAATSPIINIVAGLTHKGLVVGNKIATYDTAAADTASVEFGTLLPLDNTLITNDSDIQQSVVGKRLMRGNLDS